MSCTPCTALPAGEHRPALRTGFSTGAYLSATAVAACLALRGQTLLSGVSLLFPDGQTRTVNIDGHAGVSANEHLVWSIKDAGEDVDATHGLKLTTHVRVLAAPPDQAEISPHDFVERLGALTVVLSAGQGVGLVTRDGLDVPSGKPAINPTPRRMLLENITRAASPEWVALHVTVSIERGEEVAHRTLNPTLGIKHGLSILGTSGLVIPCSHAAYIATIEILIRAASASGFTDVALVTGGRSHRWLRSQHPDFPETAIVRFGDFIQQSLELCAKYDVSQVLVVCMGGKLAKYALGLGNTHARQHAQSPGEVADLLIQAGMDPEPLSHASDCRSVRELLAKLEPQPRSQALALLKELAAQQLQAWAGSTRIKLHVLDTSGEKELS